MDCRIIKKNSSIFYHVHLAQGIAQDSQSIYFIIDSFTFRARIDTHSMLGLYPDPDDEIKKKKKSDSSCRLYFSQVSRLYEWNLIFQMGRDCL